MRFHFDINRFFTSAIKKIDGIVCTNVSEVLRETVEVFTFNELSVVFGLCERTMAFILMLNKVKIRINLQKVFAFLIGFVIANFITREIFFSDIFLNDILSPKPSSFKSNETYTISYDLFDEVKILCLIMTRPATHKSKAQHIKNTWGKRCNKLLFLTTKEDPDLDTVFIPWSDSRKALRRKTKLGFLHVHDHYLNDYDYFLKADDDR